MPNIERGDSNSRSSLKEKLMGIRSQVRVEYWQNETRVPVTNTALYPNGSDVVARADIDASEFALAVHRSEAAWNLASLTASAGIPSLLAAGFGMDRLIECINDLKTELSDHTVIRSTDLNVAYPHPLFNTIRLVLESQSTEDYFGAEVARDVAHSPWTSANSAGVHFHSKAGSHHRNATYTIKLDELYEKMSATPDRFYSGPDTLRPFVFEFAVQEGRGKGAVSVLHTLTLNLFRQRQAAPKAYAEIVYWNRGAHEPFGQLVARRRLVDFSPRIWPFTPGVGDEFQFAEIPLVFENGNSVVDGKPYTLVSVNFSVVSRRKHDGLRPPIEVTANHVPFAGGMRLSAHVTLPIPSPSVDERGHPYVAEGAGSAMVIFGPQTVSPGTIVFTATQEPCEWSTRQNIRLFRGARAVAAQASVSRGADRGPICANPDF
jgi:hypothetical protein